MNHITHTFNDGGRADAGYKGTQAGDCVCRAIAVTTRIPYADVYQYLAENTAAQRRSTRTGKQPRSAANGIYTKRKWFKDLMAHLGFVWTPTMQIGSGCKVHLRADELPATGRHIVAVSKHYTALINGGLHDTFDCSRDGSRCVYGYWTLARPDVIPTLPEYTKAKVPRKTDPVKNELRKRVKQLGARLEIDEISVRVEAPMDHHWAEADVHELVSLDMNDALDRVRIGVTPCDEDSCIAWDFDNECCSWHHEEI